MAHPLITVIRSGLIGLFVLMGTTGVQAVPAGELLLWKQDPFLYGSCSPCVDHVTLSQGENQKRFDQRNFEVQTGYFVATLKGPAGTTVTLFGDEGFSLKAGYLVLKKQDGRPIRVDDLETFSGNRWVEVEAEGGWGAYTAWYRPHDGFKHNIDSVRWGRWWSQLPAR